MSDPTPAPSPATPAAPAPAYHPVPRGAISKIFGFLLWPFIRIGHEKGNPKVYLTSFSTLMYLWPVMVMGIVGPWLLNWGWVGPVTLGWIWITVVLIVIVCIGADMDRGKAIFLIMLTLILWLFGYFINDKYHIPVLTDIYNYLASQNVRFDPGTARVFSVATAIILVGVIIVAWFDGRYEITTLEITHRRIFQTADSLPRAAKRIKRDWRDWTEVVLGIGAGDVIVIDSNRNVVMRIPNVPFLGFFKHDVDHVLEVLATTQVEEANAAAVSEGHAVG